MNPAKNPLIHLSVLICLILQSCATNSYHDLIAFPPLSDETKPTLLVKITPDYVRYYSFNSEKLSVIENTTLPAEQIPEDISIYDLEEIDGTDLTMVGNSFDINFSSNKFLIIYPSKTSMDLGGKLTFINDYRVEHRVFPKNQIGQGLYYSAENAGLKPLACRFLPYDPKIIDKLNKCETDIIFYYHPPEVLYDGASGKISLTVDMFLSKKPDVSARFVFHSNYFSDSSFDSYLSNIFYAERRLFSMMNSIISLN